MNMGLQKRNRKQKGIKRFLNSFKYAVDGFIYSYKNEQNLMVHVFVAIVAVIFGFIFKLDKIEWLFVLVMIGLVFCAELINTSIEAVVDLVSPEKHPLAKIAKDTASGAVLSLCLVALIGGLVIYIPKIIGLFVK